MTDVALLRRYQALLAPGTPFRDGLARIVSGRTGALVVLGHNGAVEAVSTGGFRIDVDFSPTSLRELARMDGGIVVKADLGTKGVFYRVRLHGFDDQNGAKSACSKLKSKGISCFVTKT